MEIRGPVLLPARREEIELETLDGLTLVGELALPAHRDPVATLVTLHPLPTAGGFMDSHILRKAAGRLPALADLAVLRFNTRGTTSPRGTSEGAFDGGRAEEFDVAAALAFVEARGSAASLGSWDGLSVPNWLSSTAGITRSTASSCSPRRCIARPQRTSPRGGETRQVVALIPEFDDYLRPPRLTTVSPHRPCAGHRRRRRQASGGETQTRRVLTEIVAAVNPDALPLATEWDEQ
jgi:hypothetical protein